MIHFSLKAVQDFVLKLKSFTGWKMKKVKEGEKSYEHFRNNTAIFPCQSFRKH